MAGMMSRGSLYALQFLIHFFCTSCYIYCISGIW